MRDKYILVGGKPFTGYTGTTTYTSLKVVGSGNSKSDMVKLVKDHYDECGGLILIIDAETSQPVEGW